DGEFCPQREEVGRQGKNKVKKLLALLVLCSVAAYSATMASTTLNGAITASATSIVLTDATGVVKAGGRDAGVLLANTLLFVDQELIKVATVSGNTVTVERGAGGTTAAARSTVTVLPETVATLINSWSTNS